MLTLPIKKKWFDMILSGEKKEEYREIKPYYISRFANAVEIPKHVERYAVIDAVEACTEVVGGINIEKIKFRNGYRKDSPSFVAKCTLSIGKGKEEWGAEKDKQYFVLTIHEIMRGSD